MIHLRLDPPLPTKAADGPFSQKITLLDDMHALGAAEWHSSGYAAGVTQILELSIDPTIRRRGHGRRLLMAIIEQSRVFHRASKSDLRRLWIAVGHKENVIGRSFLTKEGFHHIGSAAGILRDQDLLVYVKSLD